jgi:Protein of unknown function (DUF4012)
MNEAVPRQRSRSPRRNKITRNDAISVAVAGCAAGLAAAFAGMHPTGWPASDVALSFGLTLFVVWLSASSPWWAIGLAGAIGVATGSNPAWIVVAACATGVALVIGARRLNQPPLRALSAGLSLQALFHMHLSRFTVSAALTTVACLLVGLPGLLRRNRFVRRRVWIGATVLGGCAVLAIIGAGIGAAQARPGLQHGEQILNEAASAVRRGDATNAAELFASAAASFQHADEALRRPWALVGRAVPVVGQHVRALDDLTSSASTVSGDVAGQVRLINLDSLKLSAGVIDVPAVEALGEPLRRTHDALATFSATIRQASAPWLVEPVTTRLRSVLKQIDTLVEQTDRAGQAISLAPSMLGASGIRTYFLGFTNPAEARGLGGFLGNWAELQVSEGRISVVQSGRTKSLFATGPNLPVLTQSDEYFARYGRTGAGGHGQPVSVDFWSNITMSPDLPTVAGVIADLYPQSGGEPVDGVIMIDPTGLAGLLKLTGAVAVDGVAEPIDSNNVAEFLTRGQYTAFPDAEPERAEALQKVTDAATARLLGGDLPGVRVIADALAPAIRDGHLSIWSLQPKDQPALINLGVAHALPNPQGDGFGLVTNNAGGNKLDAYLKRTVTYTGVANPATGEIDTVASVSLTNDAPGNVLDLPDYVAGNAQQLPKGTNKTYVSIYSLLPLTAAAVDGVATGTEVEQERGWAVYSTYVDIAPHSTVRLTFTFHGTFDRTSGYRLVLWPQSLVNPQPTTVRVTDGSDRPVVSFQGILNDVVRLGSVGHR